RYTARVPSSFAGEFLDARSPTAELNEFCKKGRDWLPMEDAKLTENDQVSLPEFDLDSGAVRQRFSAAEMINCAECERANPPNRTNCIYCAAALPFANQKKPDTESDTAPTPATAEGYCVVLSPRQEAWQDPAAASSMASLLHLKPEDLSA